MAKTMLLLSHYPPSVVKPERMMWVMSMMIRETMTSENDEEFITKARAIRSVV
jgi:hypothetical protein